MLKLKSKRVRYFNLVQAKGGGFWFKGYPETIRRYRGYKSSEYSEGRAICRDGLHKYFNVPAKTTKLYLGMSGNPPIDTEYFTVSFQRPWYLIIDGHEEHIYKELGELLGGLMVTDSDYSVDSEAFYVWMEYE